MEFDTSHYLPIEIIHETGYATPELRIVNLGSFASVSEFVDGLEADDVPVDVLLLNAGIYTFDYEKSQDGYESS